MLTPAQPTRGMPRRTMAIIAVAFLAAGLLGFAVAQAGGDGGPAAASPAPLTVTDIKTRQLELPAVHGTAVPALRLPVTKTTTTEPDTQTQTQPPAQTQTQPPTQPQTHPDPPPPVTKKPSTPQDRLGKETTEA
jgi:outer membrane biosynthesis protein TonB